MNIRKWIPFLLLELIAFLHVMRIVLEVDVVIDGDIVPISVSVGAIILFGFGGWLVMSGDRTPGADSG